jgi:hypothetical protein
MYSYNSFTNDPLWREGIVDSVTTTGAANCVFVLTAGSSSGRRKNDVIQLKDNKTAVVTNVTTAAGVDTIYCTSVDGTNLTIAAADVIKFNSAVGGEASISRQSVFTGLTKYSNLVQIFNETHIESDVQKLSRVEVPASGVWSVKEYAEKFLKHKADVNVAFLNGNISASQFTTDVNAIIDPEGGGILQFTRGLKAYISSWGVNDTVSNPGTISLTGDISDMIDLLVANKASNQYDMWGSTSVIGKVDDYIKSLGSAATISSARMSMDGTSINFNVEKIQYKGFTLQKYLMPILNQYDIFGGTDYAKGLFYTPSGGKIRTQDTEGYPTYEPFIQIRYKVQPANLATRGNGIWAEIHSGAYSLVNPNGDRKNAVVDFTTSQGLEVLGAQHFGYQKVLA